MEQNKVLAGGFERKTTDQWSIYLDQLTVVQVIRSVMNFSTPTKIKYYKDIGYDIVQK